MDLPSKLKIRRSGHDVNVLCNLKLIWNTLKAFLNELKDRSSHRNAFHKKGVFQKARMYRCSSFVVNSLKLCVKEVNFTKTKTKSNHCHRYFSRTLTSKVKFFIEHRSLSMTTSGKIWLCTLLSIWTSTDVLSFT